MPLREIVLDRLVERAAAAGLRHHRPLHRRRRDDRRREGAEAHAHRMGERARRRRGIRRPPDPAGRQRQRHRQAPGAQLPEHAEADGAPSMASPSRSTNWRKAGIITKEMIYVAERENLGRKKQLERAEAAARRRRELRRLGARLRHAGIRARAKSRAAAPSSRPTSTTPNSSR